MQPNLVRSLAEHAYLREHLLAAYREAIDEETLRDTLEGISDLPEALAAVVRSYLDDLMMAAALGMRIEDMQARLSRSRRITGGLSRRSSTSAGCLPP
jgi:predicted RNA-binding protein